MKHPFNELQHPSNEMKHPLNQSKKTNMYVCDKQYNSDFANAQNMIITRHRPAVPLAARWHVMQHYPKMFHSMYYIDLEITVYTKHILLV